MSTAFSACSRVKESPGKRPPAGYLIAVCCPVISVENLVARADNDGPDNDDRADDRDDRS